MAAKLKYRDIVREIAHDNYGFVTTKAAVNAGVPAVELPKLAARGGLTNIGYGLYRVSDIPPTHIDQYAEALLRMGDDSYLHGESVLALFNLAEVNSRQVRIASLRRVRAKLPAYIKHTRVTDSVPNTFYEGLHSQPVAEALLECRGRIETNRLADATRQARKDGLLTAAEAKRVLQGLRQGDAAAP